MPEPHDWPFEQPARGTLRPGYLTAAGYLAVLFSDRQEAQRARRGLLEWGMPENDIRLYHAGEILEYHRPPAARTFPPGQDNRRSGRRSRGQTTILGQRTGRGSALWLFAPTEDRADQLVGFLADYHYRSSRYYGDQGVKDIHRDAD
jgi:hypothetical protein